MHSAKHKVQIAKCIVQSAKCKVQSAKCKVQSAKRKVQSALYMVHTGENGYNNVLQLSRGQGRVVVLTRLRVVFHIERVERHIKMTTELIKGLFWSPTLFCYGALLYSKTISYDCKYIRKLLCCAFVTES